MGAASACRWGGVARRICSKKRGVLYNKQHQYYDSHTRASRIISEPFAAATLSSPRSRSPSTCARNRTCQPPIDPDCAV